MASNTETGHVINIDNFKTIVDKAVLFTSQGVYQPSNNAIKVPQLQALWTSADSAQTTLTQVLANSKPIINQRKLAFEPLDKLVTRCYNSLKSTNADKELVRDVKSVADKIRGYKVKHPKTDDNQPPQIDWVSNSHLSYVQKASSFRSFIDLLLTTAEYSPAEIELTTFQLNSLYTSLKNLNDTFASNVITPVDAARNQRNHILYDHNTGMVDVAQKVKDYVKSVFGATAPETKQVVKIAFTRLKT